MKKIVKCDTADYNSLLKIWERSVLATHYFLTEDIIAEIKDALIPHYFPNVDLYAIDENGSLAGFVGLANDNIEMLFIDCNKQGRGLGSMLIEFAKHMAQNSWMLTNRIQLLWNFMTQRGSA